MLTGAFTTAEAGTDDRAPFVRLLSDPAEQRQLLAAAARSQVMIQHPCADAHVRIEPRYVPMVQPTADESGAVIGGAWIQIISEQGCDETHTLNVLVTAQPDGKLAMMALLPGDTHAGPVLQRDAVPIAGQLLTTVERLRDPECKQLYISDTKFLAYEGDPLPQSKGPSWKELWTLETCKHVAILPMAFIPDATGTSISAGPGTAVQVTDKVADKVTDKVK
jgi:hypothetical protein